MSVNRHNSIVNTDKSQIYQSIGELYETAKVTTTSDQMRSNYPLPP